VFYLLALLTGITISVMIFVNGGLTANYGLYMAAVIIHAVGLIANTVLVLVKKQNPFANLKNLKQQWFIYMGGVIGVFTIMGTNLAFGRISVSAMLAIALFGQMLFGIIIDQYGLFGMPKYAFKKTQLIGLTIILSGIIAMITNFEIVAVFIVFLTGFSIVLARTLNAKLADLTTVPIGTFYNHVTGLIVCLAILFIWGHDSFAHTARHLTFVGLWLFSPNWYIYMGGILGLIVIILSNLTVIKVSAFYLTLLVFIGQVFSGVVIDMLITQEVSIRNIIGGVLVTIGLSVNLLLDNKAK